MTESVVLPAWLVWLLGLLAAWAALDRLLMPSVRWFLRRNANRVIDELNVRLQIEIPSFQRTRRQALVERLIYDPRVLEAVEAHAREHEIPHAVVMGMVQRYAREIVPAFNAYVYFRIAYLVARRVARLLYRVRLASVDQAGLAAIPRGATVVFVMNHRSNMDYILVGYLAADQTALSYAVGEWARIWPLQTLIRAMGAYFVRRHSRDAVYRRVLECYVGMATAAGVPQAIYPEGGLSRDGALREPRLGLLEYMMRSFNPDEGRDIVFVPIGINYDRTLEDRTLLRDLDADAVRRGVGSAVMTTLRFLLHNLRLMLRNRWYRFGYACVVFGAPISLRNYLHQRQIDFRTLSGATRFDRVADLGRDLMKAVGAVVPVLPVSLVATIFVRYPTRSLSELELKAEVLGLIQVLEARGAHLHVPRSDRDYAVTVGLRTLTLRRLVEEREGLYTGCAAELPLLQYYANAIAHLLPESDSNAAAVPAATFTPEAPR